MTPQELLDEWRKYPAAREAFAQKVHQGQATEIGARRLKSTSVHGGPCSTARTNNGGDQ